MSERMAEPEAIGARLNLDQSVSLGRRQAVQPTVSGRSIA